jgi:hypothetical protein
MVNHITVDPATAAKFHRAEDVVAVRTESGDVIGYFAPCGRATSLAGVPEFSKEELDAWYGEPGGRSLKEIMVDLQNLP